MATARCLWCPSLTLRTLEQGERKNAQGLPLAEVAPTNDTRSLSRYYIRGAPVQP